MAHDVFISHSAKDKTIADAVCAALESEGVRCWIAPRDVMPGMEWGRSIIEAIEQAKIMVLLFTANSNASPQIRREVERAVNHDVAILPFRIENILPDKSLEYFIGNVHWLDALTPPIEKHIERLVGTVKALLAPVHAEEMWPTPRRPKQSAPEMVSGADEAPAIIPGQLFEASPGRQTAGRNWLFGALGTAVLLCASLALYYGLRSNVAGAQWVMRHSGTSNDVNSIFTIGDGKQVWAGDGGGWALVSSDGGATWTSRFAGIYDGGLASIFGTSNGKKLWVSGFMAQISESDDGGVTWTHRDSNAGREFLSSIFGTSDGMRVWIVGSNGTILQSDDEGGTWIPQNSGTSNWLYSVFATSDGAHVWAAGEGGAILESDDGGKHWTARSSGTKSELRSIFGAGDGKHLWAVGKKGTVLESDDGGSTWSALKSGTDQDLRSIFSTRDGEHLWCVGAGGVILQSDDAGATWKMRNSGTAAVLYAILGTGDGKHLWAVGDNGTILESDSGN